MATKVQRIMTQPIVSTHRTSHRHPAAAPLHHTASCLGPTSDRSARGSTGFLLFGGKVVGGMYPRRAEQCIHCADVPRAGGVVAWEARIGSGNFCFDDVEGGVLPCLVRDARFLINPGGSKF